MTVIANPTKRRHPAVQTHSVTALSILQSAISAFDAAEYAKVSIPREHVHCGSDVSESVVVDQQSDPHQVDGVGRDQFRWGRSRDRMPIRRRHSRREIRDGQC